MTISIEVTSGINTLQGSIGAPICPNNVSIIKYDNYYRRSVIFRVTPS